MGDILPFRKARRTAPARRNWTRPGAYRKPPAPRRARPKRKARWFPVALVALPVAAFSAVLLLPVEGGPPAAEGAVPPAGERRPVTAAMLDAAQPQVVPLPGGAARAGGADRERANFALCAGGRRVTCVVDGDTIWYRGEKIRIADLDTPEVSNPGCAHEAAMGRKATLRLQALLNDGPFTLEPDPDGEITDKYGRSLKLVTRGGESLGAVLVAEGLAEQWGGPRVAWC
jgi:endonuclease YncB( thermonuclease family)